MAKDLWCSRCETELDWSELTPPPPGDAESIFCSHCGAFAGPGSDEVLLIENMTIEDMAAMAAAKEDAEPEVDAAGVPIYPAGGIVFTPAPPPLQAIVDGASTTKPFEGQLVAVRNESGGVDIQITIGEAVAGEVARARSAVTKALSEQFAAAQARGDLPMASGSDPLAPYAEAGKALLDSLKPAPDPVKVRIADSVEDFARRHNGPLPAGVDTVEDAARYYVKGVPVNPKTVELAPQPVVQVTVPLRPREPSSFDSAFDGAIRHALTIDHAEPEAKPHMRVPTFEEKEAQLARDRARIAAQWDALRPKG